MILFNKQLSVSFMHTNPLVQLYYAKLINVKIIIEHKYDCPIVQYFYFQ